VEKRLVLEDDCW